MDKSNIKTQIAPTPIIKGKEAEVIFKEANKIPSDKINIGAEKLKEFFEKMIQNDD